MSQTAPDLRLVYEDVEAFIVVLVAREDPAVVANPDAVKLIEKLARRAGVEDDFLSAQAIDAVGAYMSRYPNLQERINAALVEGRELRRRGANPEHMARTAAFLGAPKRLVPLQRTR